MVQKRENTLVRQKEIIDAAGELAVQYGSEHLTVRRIAQKVGFSEGAIYRHFKSKKDILSLLVEHIEDNLMGDIERARTAARSPLEILNNVIRNHISSIQKRKGISFQVIAEVVSLGDKKLNRKVADVIDRYTTHIEDLLSQGIDSEEIREDVDLDIAAKLLFGMIQGLVNIWVLSDYSFNLEEKCVPVWTVFYEGVVKH